MFKLNRFTCAVALRPVADVYANSAINFILFILRCLCRTARYVAFYYNSIYTYMTVRWKSHSAPVATHKIHTSLNYINKHYNHNKLITTASTLYYSVISTKACKASLSGYICYIYVYLSYW